MSRIRVQAPIDEDSASPESIAAALSYVANLLFERAESLGVALNWNTFKVYTRHSRRQNAMLVTGWAKVMK